VSFLIGGNEMKLKEKFIDEAISKGNGKPTLGFDVLVTLVKLPTGAVEVITNTKKIDTKIEYLVNAYDDNFCLKANPEVQIVGYTIY
jgi:hypothetical protein